MKLNDKLDAKDLIASFLYIINKNSDNFKIKSKFQGNFLYSWFILPNRGIESHSLSQSMRFIFNTSMIGFSNRNTVYQIMSISAFRKKVE